MGPLIGRVALGVGVAALVLLNLRACFEESTISATEWACMPVLAVVENPDDQVENRDRMREALRRANEDELEIASDLRRMVGFLESAPQAIPLNDETAAVGESVENVFDACGVEIE